MKQRRSHFAGVDNALGLESTSCHDMKCRRESLLRMCKGIVRVFTYPADTRAIFSPTRMVDERETLAKGEAQLRNHEYENTLRT